MMHRRLNRKALKIICEKNEEIMILSQTLKMHFLYNLLFYIVSK